MSKNVVYVIIGLVLVLIFGFILQSTVINSLLPTGENIVVPDTHQKPPTAAKPAQPAKGSHN